MLRGLETGCIACHVSILLWWRERVERIKAFERLDELKVVEHGVLANVLSLSRSLGSSWRRYRFS